ncbi:MAG: hypothetical protein PF508_12230, partial [Spirochaeta sp.]|nr:hypothetical protein [Spirochaeta sp.]
VEELYQDTAEDQAAADRGATAQELVPFVIAGRGNTSELAIVNLDTVEIAGEQTVPVVSREVVPYQGGLLAAHAASGRLLLLDSSSLAVIAESDTTVVPGARIRVIGQSVLTVVVEGNTRYIGEFDAQLLLQRRSREAVNANTDIVARGEELLVQGADGTLRTLNLEENFEAR